MNKRITAFVLAIVMLLGTPFSIHAADRQKAFDATAAVLTDVLFAVKPDTLGYEWTALALARSGYPTPEGVFAQYYANVAAYVAKREGVLGGTRQTDYARVTLAVTALGMDARILAGYDMTMPLADFDVLCKQGVNGPAYALLALDSGEYPVPENRDVTTQATRDMFVDEILSRQLNDGGFSLTGGRDEKTKSNTADPDITAIVLQALTPYRMRTAVAKAIDRALACLSETQNADGGYTSWNATTSESVSQVIIALCSLGIPLTDTRFVKENGGLMDNLLGYYIEGKGFKHIAEDKETDSLATYQAFSALVAANRAENNMTALYDCIDARPAFTTMPEGLPNRHADVLVLPIVEPGASFPDIAGHTGRIAIEALAERGIVNGNGGKFAPEANITRMEFSIIVTRALGLPLVPLNKAVFKDVPADIWYAPRVGSAVHYGIVYGSADGFFSPNGLMNRAEAAAMVTRAAKLCGMETGMTEVEVRNTLAQFGDYTNVPSWARGQLAFCYQSGILGMDSFVILPAEKVTRAEISEMLYRMLDAANML